MKHLHHIVPKHAGGTNDSSNQLNMNIRNIKKIGKFV